jgi:hypothetical protein
MQYNQWSGSRSEIGSHKLVSRWGNSQLAMSMQCLSRTPGNASCKRPQAPSLGMQFVYASTACMSEADASFMSMTRQPKATRRTIATPGLSTVTQIASRTRAFPSKNTSSNMMAGRMSKCTRILSLNAKPCVEPLPTKTSTTL